MLHISLKSPLGTWNKRMRACVRVCMYVKTEAFENNSDKSVLYCRFLQRFWSFYCGRQAKTHQKICVFVRNRISVDRGKHNETLAWSKIFCFVFVETKTVTFKNALVRHKLRPWFSNTSNQRRVRAHAAFWDTKTGMERT